jgi:uncharacterized protein YegL
MKANKTSILLILDRSGSMQGLHSDLVNGINRFIEDQKQITGECNVSVIAFDTQIEEVLWEVPLGYVPTFNTKDHFVPRGGTALYDATAHGIDKLGEHLSKLPEEERPEKVIVLIYTDGEENSSRKVNSEILKQKIEHQTNAYSWVFVYLGANQDAVLNASNIGISASNSLTYSNNSTGMLYAYSGMSIMTSGCRTNNAYAYTQADRDLALAPTP